MIRRLDLRGQTLDSRELRSVVPRAGMDVEQAVEAVRPTCEKVKSGGEMALIDLTDAFDGVRLKSIRVPIESCSASFSGG